MVKGKDLKTLQQALNNNYNIPFDTKLSIKLARLKSELSSNTKIYDEVVKKLINECAELDENNEPKLNEQGNIILKNDKINKWSEGWRILQDEEFSFAITFTMDELDNMKLTPAGAEVFLNLIEETPVI